MRVLLARAVGLRATALAALLAAGLVGCGGSGSSTKSQGPSGSARRPFPQNVAYAGGFKPGNVTAADAQAAYDLWKARYVKSDCGAGLLRVEFTEPMGTTVSEGMGYGMLLTAYFGDQTAFDQLYAFVKKNWNDRGLMGWKVTCSGPITDPSVYGQNAATDGELDIALALVVAANQWGGSYREEARGYVNRIRSNMWQYCSATGLWVQRPGDVFGGCEQGNTSYWMPGHYRVFRELTGDSFWDQAVSGAYTQIFANRNPVTGLMSNEADQYGGVVGGYAMVDYNGARTPWRIVTDYLWWGAPEAKDVTDKMTDWAASRGIGSLVDGLATDGTAAPGHNWTRSNPFTGGWATAAMSHSQARVDEFSANFKACGTDDGYYAASLRALYMLTLSGNLWRPSGQ